MFLNRLDTCLLSYAFLSYLSKFSRSLPQPTRRYPDVAPPLGT